MKSEKSLACENEVRKVIVILISFTMTHTNSKVKDGILGPIIFMKSLNESHSSLALTFSRKKSTKEVWGFHHILKTSTGFTSDHMPQLVFLVDIYHYGSYK
ncbi:hypothetical protein P8452_34017 [Trifolium repens]|nr:hypothetical protein P8452_34017 [Trifolium repens]